MKLATFFFGASAFLATLFIVPAFGQTGITLNQANMPLSASSFVVDSLSFSSFTNPPEGAAQTWNYTSGQITVYHAETFYASTDPSFSPSAIYDTIGFDPLVSHNGSVYGINYHHVYAASASAITNPGIALSAQAYNIGSVSGNSTDSLWVPQQDAMYSSPETYLALPATFGTNWSTANTRLSIDMKVKIAILAGVGYPGVTDFNKVSYFTTSDSVVGWGNLIVSTHSGTSASMPVLMVKTKTIRTDSFYLNNTVPPSLVLEGFGLAEGTVTTSYSYHFMAEGSVLPLFAVDYSDPNYSTPTDYYSYQSAPASVAAAASENNGLHIFPNPAQSRTFYVQVDHPILPTDQIQVMDATGKVVSFTHAAPALNGTLVSISLPAGSAAGTYFIQIRRANGAVEQSKLELAP